MKSKSFLVINPFGIGDVIFTSPVIRAIKEKNPNARIYYLCNSRTSGFLQCHPLIDGVIVYDRDEFVRVQKESKWQWFRKMKEFLGSIRRKDIDIAIDYSMNTYFGLFAFLGGIGTRVGLNYKNRGRFLTKKIEVHGFEKKHVSEYYADVARAMDIPVKVHGVDFYYDQASRDFAAGFWKKNELAFGQQIIGIAPLGGQTYGADAHIKQWPKEKFAKLVNRLSGQKGKQIVLFGSKAEKKDIEEIVKLASSDHRNIILACDQTVVQTAALIDKCDLIISNDSGLLHIAEALKKKCIALFGPTDYKVYGFSPYVEGRHKILCTKPECWPCYKNFRLPQCQNSKKCLNDITVDAVLDAVNAFYPCF